MRLIILATNCDRLADRQSGAWLSEITDAWEHFHARHHEIFFASPRGGNVPVDPSSVGLGQISEAEAEFRKAGGMELLTKTHCLSELHPSIDEYDGIYIAGGHGTMSDFPQADVGKWLDQFHEDGGTIAAVCHGVSALLGIPRLIVDTVCCFTNREEQAAGLSAVVPFSLEDKIIEKGYCVLLGPPWQSCIIGFSRQSVVTGQNPQSSRAVAEMMERML